MADLDAELLALAGGDSSGDESLVSPQRRKSSSPAASLKEDTPPPTRKSIARKVVKGRKRRDYSDDEDDMSGSEASASASMSQSESEAEFETTDDKPMFAYERLYHSAADKAELDAKPEIEREAILAERNELLEKREQDVQLRRMLQTRAKEEAKHAKKRKASAADLDEKDPRKSSRQRTKVGGENKSAMAAYRKQREEKALQAEQRKSGAPVSRRDPLLDEYSDADAEGESEDDRDRGYKYDSQRRRQRTPTPPRDDPPAELSDIQRVRIGRENFAQVAYTPGMEEALTNCYARVCLGPGRNGGNEYRLCSIKGFQEGKPYAIEGPNRKQMLVNKYILAAHGKATKPWSFLECSNSKFTDDEWRRYRTTMANEEGRMPTRGQISKKLEEINRLISHRFSDMEISQKLKQQNAIFDQVNRTSERKAIKEKIMDAEEQGDEDAIKELEHQLMNLVPLKLAMGTSLNAGTTAKANTEADRLAELNRHNQKQMTENYQKAAMLKRRQYKKAQAQAQGLSSASDKDKFAVPGASQTKSLDDDLFGSASDISRAGTPVNGTSRAGTPLASKLGNGANISRSGTPLSMRAGGEKKGLPVIKKTKRDDEVLAGMDLGIDIDI
ncbi:RNA polymerase-associated protein rtf1 [Knufia obscura]|uniref:RNA polymerase-associated protein rtf1 n=2 Tax=Knufia TaxID=430999 RepID=A0AAN8EKU1_9EURO|nr:RNA polymerase-associated protein rtf1 [Knufia obscura]KAK5958094.1 RNA polymerase-associated protein rtf1 [Knufia fluminis]